LSSPPKMGFASVELARISLMPLNMRLDCSVTKFRVLSPLESRRRS
jgi:hypothetical protein